MSAPTVMVSSTFYDLKQVRADLAEFISIDLGYKLLSSELDSFPVDPDADTIENSRRRVENEADLLVLIIGGRYGTIDVESDKSITNLEYLAARAKGIPIYVFVEKRILAVLPTWERNPHADFSEAVDNIQLFEFINEIRSVHKIWTHEFETAQEIIAALKTQFAHSAKKGIEWNRKLFESRDKGTIESLTGESLRIALEKPDAWEYKLFAQILVDEVAAMKDLRQEYELGITYGVGENVSFEDFDQWSSPRLQELERAVEAINILINKTAQDAFGPLDESGDLGQIVFVAKKIGEAYGEAIRWALRVRRAACEDYLEPVVDAMSKFPVDIIEKIEKFGSTMLKEIENALAQPDTGEARTLTMSLQIDLHGLEEYQKALDKALKEFKKRL